MALQRQSVTIPVSEGIDTKTDSKQVMAGKALALENVRFQKTGKLSKRFALVEMTNLTRAGNISSLAPTTIVSDNETINVLTSDGVYNYSNSLNQWEKVSPLNDFPKISSEFINITTLNQYNPDIDYSSNLKLIANVYREREEQDSLKGNSLEYVTVCTEDENTGLKKLKRIAVTTSAYKTNLQKILILEKNNDFSIIVFYQTLSGYTKIVLNKYLEILNTTSFTPSGYTPLLSKIDIVKDGTNVFMSTMANNTLVLYKYDYDGLLISTSTHTTTVRLGKNSFDQTSFGFSTCVDANNLHVFYIGNYSGDTGSRIVGIGFNKSLVNTITESELLLNFVVNVSICKNNNKIEIAVQEVRIITSGLTTYLNSKVYLCEATFTVSYSFITDNNLNNNGSRLEICSRPFVINSDVYVVCKCPESFQKSGFIYSLNKFRSVGIFSPFSLSETRSVLNASYQTQTSCNAIFANGKLYTSLEKIYGIDTDDVLGYEFIANQAITNLLVDFNTNYLTGTKTKIGDTIYFTNGRTIAFDSRGAYEAGFELHPTIDLIFATTGTANPNVASKNFSYIAIYIYYNGKGEIERSMTSPSVSITTPSNTSYVNIRMKTFPFSYKDSYEYLPLGGADFSKELCDIVLYRTENNGSIYYRCGNIPNRPVSQNLDILDAVSDSDLKNNERLYTTGGILESDPFSNAKFSTAGGNRLFLGGLEDKDEIIFSKKQLYKECVSFSDFFRIRVSSGSSADKTPISALGYMDGKVIIFREQSVYFVQGDGPNELGIGQFSEPEIISSDVGCSEPRSVINTPDGVMFKSRKGIYLLSRNLSVEYIGAPVEEFNDLKVISSLVSDKYNEARFYLINGICVVYNFLFRSWSTFNNQTTVNADIWQTFPVLIKNNLVHKETENIYIDSGLSNFYSMKFTSPWLKLDNIQGYIRCYQLWIIGDYKSPHTLKCRVYVDYNNNYYDEYSLVYNSSSSPQYQFQISLPVQKVESIKFEIFDSNQSGNGESYDLSSIQVEVGLKSGGFKLAPNKSY